MKLPVIAASLLASSVAFAQAPGDTEPSGDGAFAAPGMVTPAPVVVVTQPPVRRWSISLGVGGLELAPHSMPDATADFDIASLAVRYRAWRHLEVELAFAGGDESENADGYNAQRSVSQAVLALRYRFRPERHWNWWLMAGIGALQIDSPQLDSEQRDKATKSTLQFGLGTEYRWTQFALGFEARAVGVKRDDEEYRADAPGTMTTYSSDGWAGGQFTFSGNYYF